MKRIIVSIVVLYGIMLLSSCARGITPYEAANGKARCGKYIK